jgi:hypothetical protein
MACNYVITEHSNILYYSPDLASSDCHLVPALKQNLSVHKVKSDHGVDRVATRQLITQGTG